MTAGRGVPPAGGRAEATVSAGGAPSAGGSASVLMVGNDVVGERMAGPGIRSWEMAWAVHRAGGRVILATPAKEPPPAPFATVAYGPRGQALRAAAREADVILLQSLVLSHYPFFAALEQPLVIDLYDPFVLENLPGRAHRSRAARDRHHAADVAALGAQLDAGDLFLCASDQQRDLWLGALAARGRVNPATYAQDPALRGLIEVVPFGLPAAPPEDPEGPILKGVVEGIGPEDRVLLWGGGIWSWFDPLTLLRAVARVAEDEPRLRLFFLGTRSPNPNVPPAPQAQAARDLARDLGLLGRVVHFNDGWVPYAARGAFLMEADIGVSCHLPYVEARFAYRTRLLDYIWAGLPMLVTAGDAVADLVARRHLGEVVPPQDVPATAAALGRLLAVVDDGAARADMAARFDAVRPELTWDRAVAPLLGFLASPRRAADGPPGRTAAPGVGAAGRPGAGPTPWRGLPRRAWEVLGEGGPLMLLEEAARYARWLRRPR